MEQRQGALEDVVSSERTLIVDFLIPRRPLSSQAKARNLQKWKQYVRDEAAKVWLGEPLLAGPYELTIVYLSEVLPPDVDNIVKPIQDALKGLVMADDSLISDVRSHRRPLNDTFDLTHLPELLILGLATAQECVYVRLGHSKPLESYL